MVSFQKRMDLKENWDSVKLHLRIPDSSGVGNRTRVSTVRGLRARPLHYTAIKKLFAQK